MKRCAAGAAAAGGVFWAVVLLCVGGVRAQSVFNLNFLGQRVASGDARAIGLGGSVQLAGDSLGVLQHNPAMLAYINRVTFAASVYAGTALNQSRDLSDKEGGIKFTSLAIGFTLTRHINLGVAYHARYDATSGFTTPRTTPSGDAYTERLTRTGGVRSFPFTVAASLGRVARVGTYVSVETGSIEDRWDIDFASLANIDAFSLQSRTMSGTGYGAGVDLSLPGNLAVSGTWNAEIRYDTDVHERNTNSSANGSYTETTVLPERWTGSVRWGLGGGRSLHAGGTYSDFTRFEGLAFPRERLRSEWIAALGYEQPGLIGPLPLRFGASIGRLPYTLPAGKTVSRFGISAGTTWIPPGRQARLDFALEFAQIGSTSTNGFETRSFRFYLGFSGGERWRHHREDL